MKKLLIIFALLIGTFSYSQVMLNKATKYLGITTTVRNTLTINANEFPVIYNTTTGQFERYNGATWETWVAGESITESQISDLQTYTLPADFDTFAELNALVADVTLLHTTSGITSAMITNNTIANEDLEYGDYGDIIVGAGGWDLDASVVETGNVLDGTIDELDLDASVNASLDLADSSTQPGDLVNTLNTSGERMLGKTTAGSGAVDLITDVGVRAFLNVEDGSTADQTAAEVTIADVGTYFTATDVEGALQELGAGGGGDLSSTDIDTSAEIAAITTDETGSGALVFATSPTLVTPALGTPASGVGTNITGIVSSNVTYDNTISGLTATDIKAAIDELDGEHTTLTSSISDNSGNVSAAETRLDSIVTVLNTVPTSNFTFYPYTAAQTVTSDHLKDDAIVELDYNAEDFTIHKDSVGVGEAVRIILNDAPDGEARIIEGDSVSILGYSAGIAMSTYPAGVTLTRRNATVTPAREFIVTDYFGAITDFIGSALPIIETTSTNFEDAPGDTNIEVTAPSGIVAGDMILIVGGSRIVDVAGGSQYTPPSGFTEIIDGGDAIADVHIFASYKIAAGGESGTLTTVTANGSVAYTVTAYRISGVDNSTPIGQTGTVYDNTGNPATVTEVTTANPYELAFVIASSDGSDSNLTTASSGWTLETSNDNSDTFNHTMSIVYTKDMVSAGATGDVSITNSTADGVTGVQFSIRSE